jgi:hypothetical protein
MEWLDMRSISSEASVGACSGDMLTEELWPGRASLIL